MSRADEPLLAEVGVLTLRLLALAAGQDDASLRGPSRLPGWSRGHVLSHLVNQGAALAGVLAVAATGEVASMYPSQQERDEAIDAGAGAGGDALLRRLSQTSDRLFLAWRALPEDRLTVQFTAPAGWFRDVADGPWFRWRELALHLIDLDAGIDGLGELGCDDLLPRLLRESVTALSGKPGCPALTLVTETGERLRLAGGGGELSGTMADLATWLTGRSAGAGLHGPSPLPDLPAWA
jgi:maleylpyruvate isomerase